MRVAILDQIRACLARAGYLVNAQGKAGRNVTVGWSYPLYVIPASVSWVVQRLLETEVALSCVNAPDGPVICEFIWSLFEPIYMSAPEHPVAMGFALYFSVIWKITSFAHFKSTAWLLYWIFLTSFIETRQSALISWFSSCYSWFYKPVISRLRSLFISIYQKHSKTLIILLVSSILFPALLDQSMSYIHLYPRGRN